MTGRRGICAQHVQVEERFGTATDLKGQKNGQSKTMRPIEEKQKSRPDLDSDRKVSKENLEVAGPHLIAST